MSKWNVPELRRTMGCVFQDFRLLPDNTVSQNVAFALEVIGKPHAHVQRVVPEVLEMVGLESKAKRMPDELSGGEQQRVAVARAFVNRPMMLLADEPTGNLDPRPSRASCSCSTGSTAPAPRWSWRRTTAASSTPCADASSSSTGASSCATRAAASTGTALAVAPDDRRPHAPLDGDSMRVKFVLTEVATGLRRNLTMTIAVVVTAAICLGLLGTGLLIARMVSDMKEIWYDKVQVSVYLAGDVSDAQRSGIEASSAGCPRWTTSSTSPRSRPTSGSAAVRPPPELVENTTADALPESFRVKLVDPSASRSSPRRSRTARPAWSRCTTKASCSSASSTCSTVPAREIAVAVVQALAALLLICNTIRVAAYSRRRETGIMRLVGA